MSVVINRDLCQGYARCVGIAPDVFDLDDEDLGIVVDPDPPEALRSDVDHAVDGCPMKAIRWEPRPN